METSWTMVTGAARGDPGCCDAFARTYLPIVRAYLTARWRSPRLRELVEDAAQDVFLDCLREGGPLTRLDADAPGRFRSWLHAVTRNVALRYEERLARRRSQGDPLDLEICGDEPSQSVWFDRAWAQELLRRAAERQAVAAVTPGRARRVELLRLRFQEGLSIKEIAGLWQMEPARVHKEYAEARSEFKAALRAEVESHGGSSPGAIERECAELLARL